MQIELTGWERRKAIIAKWIVAKIACKISTLAVLSLCLEVAEKYNQQLIESYIPEDIEN